MLVGPQLVSMRCLPILRAALSVPSRINGLAQKCSAYGTYVYPVVLRMFASCSVVDAASSAVAGTLTFGSPVSSGLYSGTQGNSGRRCWYRMVYCGMLAERTRSTGGVHKNRPMSNFPFGKRNHPKLAHDPGSNSEPPVDSACFPPRVLCGIPGVNPACPETAST